MDSEKLAQLSSGDLSNFEQALNKWLPNSRTSKFMDYLEAGAFKSSIENGELSIAYGQEVEGLNNFKIKTKNLSQSELFGISDGKNSLMYIKEASKSTEGYFLGKHHWIEMNTDADQNLFPTHVINRGTQKETPIRYEPRSQAQAAQTAQAAQAAKGPPAIPAATPASIPIEATTAESSSPAPATSSGDGGGGKPPANTPSIATPPEEPSGQNSNTGKPAATSPKAKEPSSKLNTPTNQWGKITNQAAGASFEETEEFLKNFPDHEPAKTHLAILKEQDEVDRIVKERNEKKAKSRGFSSGATLSKAERNARKLESERETKAQQIEEEKQRKLERKWAAIERREANNSQKNTTTPPAEGGKPPTPPVQSTPPAEGGKPKNNGKSSTPKTWNQLLKAHGGNASNIPEDILLAHAESYPKQKGPKQELANRQNGVPPKATTPVAPTSGGSGGKPPAIPPQSSPLPEDPPNPKGTPPKRVSTEMAGADAGASAEELESHFTQRSIQRPIPANFSNASADAKSLPAILKGIGNLDAEQFENSRKLFQNDVAVGTRDDKYSAIRHKKIDVDEFNAIKQSFEENRVRLTEKVAKQKAAKAEMLESFKFKKGTVFTSTGKTDVSQRLSPTNTGDFRATRLGALNNTISATNQTLEQFSADSLDTHLYQTYYDPEGKMNAKSGFNSPVTNDAQTAVPAKTGILASTRSSVAGVAETAKAAISVLPGSGYATKETLEYGFGMGFKNAVEASRGEHLARFVSNANPFGASGRAAFTESFGIANRSDVQRFLQNRTFMNGIGAFGAPIGAAAIVGMGMHDMQDPGEILGNLSTGGAVIGGFRAGKSAGAMLTPANSKIGRGLGLAVGGTVGAVTGGLVAAGLYGIINDAAQNDSAIRKFAKKVGTKEMYSMSQDTRESLTARQQALNKLAKSGLNDRAQLLRK